MDRSEAKNLKRTYEQIDRYIAQVQQESDIILDKAKSLVCGLFPAEIDQIQACFHKIELNGQVEEIPNKEYGLECSENREDLQEDENQRGCRINKENEFQPEDLSESEEIEYPDFQCVEENTQDVNESQKDDKEFVQFVATVKIQSWFRGMLERTRIEHLKEEKQFERANKHYIYCKLKMVIQKWKSLHKIRKSLQKRLSQIFISSELLATRDFNGRRSILNANGDIVGKIHIHNFDPQEIFSRNGKMAVAKEFWCK